MCSTHFLGAKMKNITLFFLGSLVGLMLANLVWLGLESKAKDQDIKEGSKNPPQKSQNLSVPEDQFYKLLLAISRDGGYTIQLTKDGSVLQAKKICSVQSNQLQEVIKDIYYLSGKDSNQTLDFVAVSAVTFCPEKISEINPELGKFIAEI
jgi:hypothetical protein